MFGSAVKTAIVLAAFGTADVARAQDGDPDWPRFHMGVAVGEAQLGPDMSEAGVPEHIWGNASVDTDTGNKLVFGFRPIRVVGVEFQALDLGDGETQAHAGEFHALGQVSYWDQSSYMTASADATVLTALLFIPESSQWLDVYGKVGVAVLDESFRAAAQSTIAAECQPVCTFRAEVDQSYTTPYVGFGARFKVARAAAIRIEYETIDRDEGDNTTMLSVGVAVEWPVRRNSAQGF